MSLKTLIRAVNWLASRLEKLEEKERQKAQRLLEKSAKLLAQHSDRNNTAKQAGTMAANVRKVLED